MSDIGYGQRIYYKDNIYIVQSIHFKYIVVYDDKKIVRIPIKSYMEGVIEFPQPRYDDFDEKKYHEKPWDGNDRRRGLLKKAEQMREKNFKLNRDMMLEEFELGEEDLESLP
jgi:hypothetical protein